MKEQENYIEFEDTDVLNIVFYSFLEKLDNDNVLDGLEEIMRYFTEYPFIDPKEDQYDKYIEQMMMHYGYRLREADRIEEAKFINQLESDYGFVFYHLELIRLLTNEYGKIIIKEFKVNDILSKSKLFNVIIRQHIRACSIFSETIHLIKGGFGTGAMSRYRSLYELSVLMEFIYNNGEEAAEAYMDYLEVMKAKDARFLLNLHGNDDELDEVLRHYEHEIKPELVIKYDEQFANIKDRNDYIWAKSFLHSKPDRPNFGQIRESIKRSHGKEQFKLSSNNIHSAPKSMISSLGNDQGMPIAGASNLGLAEPGSWSVYEIVQLNNILFRLVSKHNEKTEDELTLLKVSFSYRLILKLANYVYTEFAQIEKQLLESYKKKEEH